MLEPGQAVQADEPTTAHLNGHNDNGDNGYNGHRAHRTDAPLVSLPPATLLPVVGDLRSSSAHAPTLERQVEALTELVEGLLDRISARNREFVNYEDTAYLAGQQTSSAFEPYLRAEWGWRYHSPAYIAAQWAHEQADRTYNERMYIHTGSSAVKQAAEEYGRDWQRRHPEMRVFLRPRGRAL